MASILRTSVIAGSFALLSVVGRVVYQQASVLGALRTVPATEVSPDNVVKIPDTIHCEDVHYYSPGGVLFTACEDTAVTRFSWFPPLDIFSDPTTAAQGSIHVIDPKTMASQRLEFHDFDLPFVTHGIDVIDDPKSEGAVYIFAVNHLPNPEFAQNQQAPKARSQIEVFHHVLGSTGVTHIRSIWHEWITTPNDVLAVSPTEMYVTNDHYYREGHLRAAEDMFPFATWSNTIHLRLPSLDKASSAEEGVEASVAAQRLHNNNGLGHGPQINATASEVLVTSAASGVLRRMIRSADHKELEVLESIHLASVADNPSFFADPYRTDELDLSGYVIGGLAKGMEFSVSKGEPTAVHPVMVWYVPHRGAKAEGGADAKLLFQDDGSTISSLSGSVIVADPPSGKGRTGWLFVTGFVSESMIAVKLDLSTLLGQN